MLYAVVGTEDQRSGLAKEGMLGAYRGESEFRLCGKAGGSTWEYPSPSRAAKPNHSSWEVTMSALHVKKEAFTKMSAHQ